MEPIIGEVEQVTDGDKEGRDGSYVEFGPGKQYVQIDLEKPGRVSCYREATTEGSGRPGQTVLR
jgi:hypothetical protein